MLSTRKLFATSMIAAACAIPGALLLSATAAADPVPAPAIPAMPNIPFLNNLSPANAPAMLQGLASMFSGFSGAPAPAAAPAAAPAQTATASLTLPQTPAVAATPAASALSAATPAVAATAPASAAGGLIPTAEVQIPQVPMNPLPLPQQLNFPGDLASLMPAGTPLANLLPKSPSAIPAVPAALAAVPAVPAAAAPALPAATTGLADIAPLMFPVAGLP